MIADILDVGFSASRAASRGLHLGRQPRRALAFLCASARHKSRQGRQQPLQAVLRRNQQDMAQEKPIAEAGAAKRCGYGQREPVARHAGIGTAPSDLCQRDAMSRMSRLTPSKGVKLSKGTIKSSTAADASPCRRNN